MAHLRALEVQTGDTLMLGLWAWVLHWKESIRHQELTVLPARKFSLKSGCAFYFFRLSPEETRLLPHALSVLLLSIPHNKKPLIAFSPACNWEQSSQKHEVITGFAKQLTGRRCITLLMSPQRKNTNTSWDHLRCQEVYRQQSGSGHSRRVSEECLHLLKCQKTHSLLKVILPYGIAGVQEGMFSSSGSSCGCGVHNVSALWVLWCLIRDEFTLPFQYNWIKKSISPDTKRSASLTLLFMKQHCIFVAVLFCCLILLNCMWLFLLPSPCRHTRTQHAYILFPGSAVENVGRKQL